MGTFLHVSALRPLPLPRGFSMSDNKRRTTTNGAVNEPPVNLEEKKQGRKRKGEPNVDNPSSKKIRGHKGKLTKLIDMPLDILIAILGLLRPFDLLQLSRSSKSWRSFLMNRSNAITVWKRSLSSLEGMPEPPSNMSEPAYASLLLEKSCHSCSRKVRCMIDWVGGIRLCQKCIKSSVELVVWWDLDPQLGHDLDPWTRIFYKDNFHSSGYGYTGYTYYCVKNLSAWSKELEGLPLDAVKTWCEAKKEQVEAIKKHGNSCEDWLHKWNRSQKTLEEVRRHTRKENIIERIQNSKWGVELSQMCQSDLEDLHELPSIVSASAKDLTERVISNLDKKINEHMSEVKRLRLQRERRELLESCLPVLKKVWEEHVKILPVNSLYPSVGEVFRHPTIQEVIDEIGNHAEEAAVQPEHFDWLRLKFPEIAAQWHKRVVQEIIDVITAEMGADYQFHRNTILDLATTLFSCNKCPAQSLRCPEVIMLDCAIAALPSRKKKQLSFPSIGIDLSGLFPDLSHNEDDKKPFTDEDFLSEILSKSYWSASKFLSFKRTTFEAMCQAVRLAGLDPNIAKHSDMNAANPVFECFPCNKKRLGRAAVGWTFVPFHIHPSSPLAVNGVTPLQLFDPAQVQYARCRLYEESMRAQAESSAKRTVCIHCKKVDNIADLWQHAMKEHKVTEKHELTQPCSRHVAPHLGTKPRSLVVYVWPPRVVEESSDKKRRRVPCRSYSGGKFTEYYLSFSD